MSTRGEGLSGQPGLLAPGMGSWHSWLQVPLEGETREWFSGWLFSNKGCQPKSYVSFDMSSTPSPDRLCTFSILVWNL